MLCFESPALLYECVAHAVESPREVDEPLEVDNPVDCSRGYLVVSEYRATPSELEVCGDDHRLLHFHVFA